MSKIKLVQIIQKINLFLSIIKVASTQVLEIQKRGQVSQSKTVSINMIGSYYRHNNTYRLIYDITKLYKSFVKLALAL